jgi:hypothetical protein
LYVVEDVAAKVVVVVVQVVVPSVIVAGYVIVVPASTQAVLVSPVDASWNVLAPNVMKLTFGGAGVVYPPATVYSKVSKYW